MSKTLYHNIEQNKTVPYVSDVLETIISGGFLDGFADAVWFSDKPISCKYNGFTGLKVEVPESFDLSKFYQCDDGLEDEGFTTYAIPAEIVNTWPREQAWIADYERSNSEYEKSGDARRVEQAWASE